MSDLKKATVLCFSLMAITGTYTISEIVSESKEERAKNRSKCQDT